MAFKLADKLGYSPPFSFERLAEEGFYEGVINYKKLADTLGKYEGFTFDYNEFLGSTTFMAPRNPLDDGINVISRDTPLVVPTENGGTRALKISGVLNKKIGRVSTRNRKIVFGFKLKLKEYTEYTKKVRYEHINENAIRLTTYSYDGYNALGQYINSLDNPSVRALINKKFNETFSKVDKDLSALKWLYENAPQFTLKQRGDQKLLIDLEKLVKYDKDSWFKDASDAILNLIKGFNDLKIVYDYFHDKPEKAIAIYDVLDTASQEQFCILLNVLCYAFTKTERRTTAKFTIGNDFTLNSNIFIKDNQKEILLEHSEIYRREVERPAPVDEFGVSVGTITTTVGIPIPIKQETIFHPLDIVTMKDQSSGEERLVCALNVKLLSDQAEWEQVINTTVLVVSVIAILVSAGTLAAGATGLTAAIAITEIVVATIDIAAILNNANLKETEEGRWFLKHWNTLSAGTGVISLSVAIRQGLLKNGPKLLSGIRKLPNSARVIQLRKFVTELLTTIQIELYFVYKQGFVFSSIGPFPNEPKIVGKPFARKMQKFGVLITEPSEAGSDIRALIYNGEKIAEGTEKELKATLKEIFPYAAKDSDVLKSLDDIVSKAKLLKFPINSVDELIAFLGKIDNTFLAGDLERVGIKALFRGTTKNVDGSLFKGNTNSQLFGLSTSTDPIRAIIFGIESASKPGRKGFLQVILPENIKNIKLDFPNRRYPFELEVVVKTNADDFAKSSVIEIPIDKARKLADDFFNLPERLPTKLDPSTGESRFLMEDLLPKMNLEDSFKFYEELLKISK